MSLQVAQIPEALGTALDTFWIAGGAAGRAVTCVTVARYRQECRSCRQGEVIVLTRAIAALAEIEEAITMASERQASGVLVPHVAFTQDDQEQLREAANRYQVGVGLLSPCVDPALAINALSRAVAAAHEGAPNSALRAADSLQELADMLGRLLSNQVTIESPHHELLAFSAMESWVDRVREETILRRAGPSEPVRWIVRKGYVDRVRESDRPVRVPPNPALDFTGRVAMRVMGHGEILAVIWAAENARPLTADDEHLLVQAADAAGGILLRQREAAQREALLRAEFLEDIVQGRISNPESIRALAASQGWAVDRRQVGIVVAIDRLEELRLRHADRGGRGMQGMRERLTEIVRLEALAVDPDAIAGPRSTGVILLVSPPHAEAEERAAAASRLAEAVVLQVGARLPEITVSVGVGREFTAFEHTAESVRQAELAARLGATLWGGNRATNYSDLGIHRALFALQEHEEMISPALQRLLEHDERHGSDYVHTLGVYLACTGRLRVAAEQLTIHRNTLEYRLRRIEQVAGISLDDSNSRLALELGIRLLEMRSLTSTETPSPLRSVAQRVNLAPQESESRERMRRIK